MEKVYYYIETEYIYGDFNEKKWALHKVENKEDEIILWKCYEDTPGYPIDNPDDVDMSWKAIDHYIQEELGFLPEYEVN